MKYIIYGVNRATKDYIYLFSSIIQIEGVVDDCVQEKGLFIEKVPVYAFEERNSLNYEKIIICDFDNTQKTLRLKREGLEYNKDYIYAEDLLYLLDEQKINSCKRPLVVWGAGGRGEKFYKSVNGRDIQFYIDRIKKGIFCNKEIKKPEDIEKWNEYFVVITPAKNSEIVAWMEKRGLRKNIDFCTMHDYLSSPSRMARKTIFDSASYDFSCDTMLNHVEVHAEGRCDCCCTTFMDISIGEIKVDNIQDIWYGIRHKIAVLSSQNHTYSFCKKDICPFFAKKNSISKKIDLYIPYKRMLSNPKVLLLAYDNGCNLKCISCRKDYVLTRGDEEGINIGFANNIKKTILPNIEFLIMAGSGEVFLNKSYKEVYLSEEAKDVKEIRFLSNGLLFNKNTWGEFRSVNKSKVFLTVSVDAATEKTYEYIRSGGNFNILKGNMNYAGELRKRGELAYFRMNFVVQKNNYKEMPDFVKWGKEIGCDEVFFTKILNWGTYTQEEFKDISMLEEDGMTPKKELQEVLKNPIMKDPIVNMGTIHAELSEIKEEYIDNYYMWEIGRTVGDVF